MINEVDIEATEARIKEFQKINQDVILANHAKAVSFYILLFRFIYL
jgi:hypothetical protein